MTINPISPQPLPVQHIEEWVCVFGHPMLRLPIVVVLRSAESPDVGWNVFARVPGIAAHGFGQTREAAIEDLLLDIRDSRDELRRDVVAGVEAVLVLDGEES